MGLNFGEMSLFGQCQCGPGRRPSECGGPPPPTENWSLGLCISIMAGTRTRSLQMGGWGLGADGWTDGRAGNKRLSLLGGAQTWGGRVVRWTGGPRTVGPTDGWSGWAGGWVNGRPGSLAFCHLISIVERRPFVRPIVRTDNPPVRQTEGRTTTIQLGGISARPCVLRAPYARQAFRNRSQEPNLQKQHISFVCRVVAYAAYAVRPRTHGIGCMPIQIFHHEE